VLAFRWLRAHSLLDMLRLLDILLAGAGLVIGLPLLTILTLACFIDTGSPYFRQVRVGQHRRPFVLVKFRTMRPGTPSVATHLADPESVTQFGAFLRRTKLDELPQLWNVFAGEMSLVGPRPCLFSQKELIEARVALGVFDARPGITGLAQVLGIDMSSPELLARTDAKMLDSLSLNDYTGYVLRTLLGKGSGDRVRGREQ
jgi:O-antigen biosynthesis protein WbqP